MPVVIRNANASPPLQQSAFLVVPAELPERGVVPADVEDYVIVAAAVAGQADVICTLDRHFQHADVKQFCASHGIRILTDVELLTIHRGGEAEPSSGKAAEAAASLFATTLCHTTLRP